MRSLKIICLSLILSACTATVNVDYDSDVNFKSYKIYNNVIDAVRVSSDTRIDSSFMKKRVVESINKTLVRNGYSKSVSKSDLKVKYYLDVKQEIETQESGMMIGFGTASANSSVAFGFNFPVGEAVSVDVLVLTIDMISTKTNKLIWRGSSGSYLSEEGTPKKYEEMIKSLVTAVLNKFPPK